MLFVYKEKANRNTNHRCLITSSCQSERTLEYFIAIFTHAQRSPELFISLIDAEHTCPVEPDIKCLLTPQLPVQSLCDFSQCWFTPAWEKLRGNVRWNHRETQWSSCLLSLRRAFPTHLKMSFPCSVVHVRTTLESSFVWDLPNTSDRRF